LFHVTCIDFIDTFNKDISRDFFRQIGVFILQVDSNVLIGFDFLDEGIVVSFQELDFTLNFF